MKNNDDIPLFGIFQVRVRENHFHEPATEYEVYDMDEAKALFKEECRKVERLAKHHATTHYKVVLYDVLNASVWDEMLIDPLNQDGKKDNPLNREV